MCIHISQISYIYVRTLITICICTARLVQMYPISGKGASWNVLVWPWAMSLPVVGHHQALQAVM